MELRVRHHEQCDNSDWKQHFYLFSLIGVAGDWDDGLLSSNLHTTYSTLAFQ